VNREPVTNYSNIVEHVPLTPATLKDALEKEWASAFTRPAPPVPMHPDDYAWLKEHGYLAPYPTKGKRDRKP
jgi:hypothetical protein